MVNRMIVSVLIMGMLAGSICLFSQKPSQAFQQPLLREVVDGAGRQVAVPLRPNKVVALNASNIDLYVSAGGSLAGRASTETLPPSVKAAVQAVPKVGLPPAPNLEKIMELQPDLVLGVNMAFHHELLPVLAKAGIPILLQNLDTYQQVLDTLIFYGELAGEPEKAAELIDRIERRSRAAIAAGMGKQPPRTLILWGTSESFNMVLAGTFTGDLMKRLGGVNVADQAENSGAVAGYAPLSLEFVVKANPELILFITHSSDEKVEAKFRAELASHPAWQGIKAVQHNRVYKLPYHLFAVNPGTQLAEAVETLANLLYPTTNPL